MSKQTVKVGDKIRITDASSYMWENGDIFEVVELHTHLSGVTVTGGAYIPSGTFEIITNGDDDNMTKEKAQVGDLIRIVDSEDAPKGAIFEVVAVEGNDVEVDGTFDDDSPLIFFPDEYVIHRKAGEEDSEQDANERFIEELTEAYADEIVLDAVNQPSHYTQGKFEVIDVIEQFTSGYDDGFTAHCIGTATKYIARAPFKHDTPLEDLRKAAKYLAFAIEHLDAKSTQD